MTKHSSHTVPSVQIRVDPLRHTTYQHSFEIRQTDSKTYNPNTSSNTALETSDCSSRLSFVQDEKVNNPRPHF